MHALEHHERFLAPAGEHECVADVSQGISRSCAIAGFGIGGQKVAGDRRRPADTPLIACSRWPARRRT